MMAEMSVCYFKDNNFLLQFANTLLDWTAPKIKWDEALSHLFAQLYVVCETCLYFCLFHSSTVSFISIKKIRVIVWDATIGVRTPCTAIFKLVYCNLTLTHITNCDLSLRSQFFNHIFFLVSLENFNAF